MLNLTVPDIGRRAGGPGTFERYLLSHAERLGWHVSTDPGPQTDVALIIGGTLRPTWLIGCLLRRIPVVQRLDGLHPRGRGDWKAVVNNAAVRSETHVADWVVYQSRYVKGLWQTLGGPLKRHSVILNGVDTHLFRPERGRRPRLPTIVCVEGTVQDDPAALAVLSVISNALGSNGRIKIAGRAGKSVAATCAPLTNVELLGSVSRDDVLGLLQSADAYLSLERDPPCPNGWLEALACGLPVIGFDTGAASEIVDRSCGVLLDFDEFYRSGRSARAVALARGAVATVLADAETLSHAARGRAVERFAIGHTMDAYAAVLEEAALLRPAARRGS